MTEMTWISSAEHSEYGEIRRRFFRQTVDTAIRVEFFGDEIDRISEIDVLTGEVKNTLNHIAIFPASHYVVPKERMEKAHS